MDSRVALFCRALPGLLIWALGGCEVLVNGEVPTIHCAREGAIGVPDCPVDDICKAGTCVHRASINPRLGSQCEEDADCSFGDFCLAPTVIGTTGEKRCSRACCSSKGCDPDAGFVCWSPPSGGVSVCLDAASVHRNVPGNGAAGAPCATGSGCRSGRCDTKGACLDVCCSDAGCAPGYTCQLGTQDGMVDFFCAPKSTVKVAAYADVCVNDGDCASGLCLDFAPGDRRCSAPCCSSDTCGSVLALDQVTPVACKYVPQSGMWVRACARLLPSTQVNTVGQACMDVMNGGDCRGGICALSANGGPLGACSDVCCSDAACGEGSDYRCRPQPLPGQGAWALRCEPK